MSDSCVGGPTQNTDISGIGVRISFYLQALFLACLSARSGSTDEVTGALYTLVVTNTAYAVTSFLQGFNNPKGISLQDAIIVFYLLGASWTAIFFALARYNRFRKGDKLLKGLTLFHSYVLFSYAFAVLATAPSFGSEVDCNSSAVVVLFRPFNAVHAGRVVGWVLMSVVLVVYTGLVIKDYNKAKADDRRRKGKKGDRTSGRDDNASDSGSEPGNANTPGEQGVIRTTSPENISPLEPDAAIPPAPAPGSAPGSTNTSRDAEENASLPAPVSHPKHKKRKRRNPSRRPTVQNFEEYMNERYHMNFDGRMMITMVFILIIWALAVMNTELLINYSHFQPADGSIWTFGQILPMFLVIVPLVSLYKVFRETGWHRRRHGKRVNVKAPKPAFDNIPIDDITGFELPTFASRFDMMFGNPGSAPRPNGGLATARISAESIHEP